MRVPHIAIPLLALIHLSVSTVPAEDPVEPLSLRECVAMALDSNLGLQSESLRKEIAQWAVRSERGAFEPDLVVGGRHSETERENTTEQAISQDISIYEEDNNQGSLALEGLLASGAQYNLGYQLLEISNNLTNQFRVGSNWDEEYYSFVGLTMNQPLLRNAGTGVTRARLKIAEAEDRIARENFRGRMMEVVAQTEAAYWDLFLAQEQKRLREESVEIAEKILSDNQERVKAGKMSELEVLQAEAGLALRQTLLRDADQVLREASNRLKTLFSTAYNDAPAFLSVSDAPEVSAISGSPQERFGDAFALHPDYQIQVFQLDQENVRVTYARNQTYPQLDLKGSYGLNGLGDTPGDSMDDLEATDYPAWSVGLELRIPIGGGRRAMAEYKAANLRKEQALLGLKAVEIEILNNLDSAFSRVESTHTKVGSYASVSDFNRRLLENELTRLEAGRSDSRKVLELEEDLSRAREEELKSLVEHRKAWLELELAEGKLLLDRGLELAELETDRP
ncbi:MAG: TolC family protein [Verrucomicrobiota bacterium]|nr:TolC family protein [Verrucomicrobiota bacterium]MDI9383218.1 TolC family protein [Verrucomicrobiota bacterium]